MNLKRKVLAIVVILSIVGGISSGIVMADDPANLITAIGVSGNLSIPEEEILNVVQTKVGEQIDNDKLRADLQSVFDLGYFFNVQVNFENHFGGVKLIFEVVENPKVVEININGTEVISDTRLLELMTLKPGMMLNTKVLNEDLRIIEEYYKNQGFVLAYIEDIDVSDDGILNVSINEGFLKDIKIMGNQKTRDYVIRREVQLQPGEVFNINKVYKDLRDIYNLGFFDDVKPQIERATDGSNKVDLVIEVEEKKTGAFNVGGGYSSKDGWLGYVEVKEPNLFGRGQRLGLKWEFGESMNYELNFFDPWAFGKEFSFGVDLYNKTNNNSKDSEKGNYSKVSRGGSLQIGRPLTEDIKGLLKFRYENTLTDWDDDQYSNEQGDTRSLTLSTVRNTTDSPFFPTTGGIDVGSIEYAGQILGGDYDFTKLNLESRRYFPGFRDGHVWALRGKVGFATGSALPYHEEFKIGGSETLRGYDNLSFSGDRMVLANLEYRFPLVSESLEGAAFIDAGDAWKNDLDELNLKFAGGVGVRMNTPLGQIRLDYAIGEDGGMPHFSIGQTF
ncbi:MAG: BamA/TamA family outer membrane protein [Halanaerobiales bacterium]|nr:BamA/TamA family outer membrane protein [Halanaerobiales bacterium]